MPPQTDPKQDAAAIAALAALTAFRPDFGDFTADVTAELTQVYLDAYQHAGVPLTATVRAAAATFATARAEQLATDLADTTEDGIDALADDARGGSLSVAALTALLRGAAVFGAGRAALIAVTEVAGADGAGGRAAAEDQGHDEKRWATQDADACDDCAANEDDGWIGIDDTFSSGDDDVPGHPRCRCSCEYRGGETKAAALPAVHAVWRCPDCHRLLGRTVNAGAELWCGRCREAKVVPA